MADLRWILLVLGVLLIGVLVLRDRLRRTQASRESEAIDTARPDRPEPAAITPTLPRASERESIGGSTRTVPVIHWDAVGSNVPDTLEVLPVISAEPLADATLETAATLEVAVAPPARIDHWPADELRKVCSLRMVPEQQEKFSGRALRLALQSTGFRHGVLGLFHLADADGRALISAANLARPGQLDPEMMDYQRFAGVQLFTVLPGPLPASDALMQLFGIGAELAQRVGGTLQDERGLRLDARRMRELQQQFVPATRDSPPQTDASIGAIS
jgi:FtsZ-interacting cell division protein ZipA